MNIPENERIDDPCEYMNILATTFLPIRRWGFQESAKFTILSPTVINNSEYCCISLIWNGWEMYTDNSISILYGRLNAPNDKYKVNWNSEECYCWHRLSGTGAVFDILDGLSPQESAKRTGFSQLINSLRQSELWQSLA